MSRGRASWFVCVLLFGVTSLAWGQAADTGSLRGRVTDSTAAALPGVTVTVSSPVVMGGSMTTVTSEEGFYRFPSLPPGVYELAFDLAGFQAVKLTDVRITVGIGLTIDRQLQVANVAETLTVSGESPIVDTKNTTAGATVTQEILEMVPSSRDLWNTVQSVPGIIVPRENVGGFESTQLSSMSVHGSGASAVQHNLNGIDMTLMHQDNLGAGYFSTDAYEEIQVTTSGISAENSRGGLIINQVMKSGSNRFSGLAGFYYENDSLMAANVDDDLRSRGVRTEGSPLDKLTDFSAQLGGPILKDRLWFFEAFRQYNVYPYVLNCFNADGSRCTNTAKLRNFTTKLNAQANASNRFMLLYEWGQKFMPNRDISQFIRPEASYEQDGRHKVWQGKYDRVLSSTMLLDAAYGMLWTPFPLAYRDGVGDATTALDQVTQVRSDAPFQNFFQEGRMRTFRSNLTLFEDNFLGGAHDFKFGVEWRDGQVPETTARNGDLQRIYSNGTPIQVWVYNTPVTRNATNEAWMAFAQDSARFGRVTATMGVRFEKWSGGLPAQTNEPRTWAAIFGGNKSFAEQKDLIAWTTVSPRLGLVFDMTGDSRNVAKVTYGRYFSQIEGNRINSSANANGIAEARFAWNDLNRNNFPDYPAEFGNLLQLSVPVQRGIVPDLESPYSDEVSATYERALTSRMSVSARYTYRKNARILADTDRNRPDSAFTIRSTAVDPVTGSTIQFWSLDPALRTVPSDVVLSQFDDNYTRYHGMDLVFDRRFDGRWLFRGSLTIQDNYGRVGGYLNRNDREIFPYGAAGLDAKQLVRLQASYMLPWQINTGISYRYTSGLNSFAAAAQNASPLARIVQVRDATNNQQYSIRVEENGEFRQDGVSVLDLRAAKVFRIGNSKVEAMIDVFNVTNANNVLASSVITGPTFNVPSNVLTPRVARLGVKFDF